ncbi:hypothetical protein GCM10027418_24290 [Mariniluteicoccus endophyticus]
MAPTPTVDDLVEFLGWGTPDPELAGQMESHLHWASAMVAVYLQMRQVPEVWPPGVDRVILSLAGRSASNPTGDQMRQAGSVVSRPGQPEFTLAEHLLLDAYRTTAG